MVSLDGAWEVGQGGMDEAPSAFDGRVEVPGLLTGAEPGFEEVGVDSELRQAFWHRRRFEAPAERRPVAIVRIGKVKYGARAFLNGQEIGEHLGAFTAAELDATEAMRWGESNELVVRVGATRAAVPASAPVGMDREKKRFLPGIYDSVRLLLTGEVRIENVQALPDLEGGRVEVRTTLRNHGDEARTVTLRTSVAGGGDAQDAVDEVSAPAGGDVGVSQVIVLSDPRAWSPEDPFLYVLDSRAEVRGGLSDEQSTRFGLRDVRWAAGPVGEGGFSLNGEPRVLRGSNITLHRFFEDPLAGRLAWDPDWVRRLLTETPRRLHWNVFRIAVGRAPAFWYDIADEEGVLLADEFQMWTLLDDTSEGWTVQTLADEYRRWMREAWNHPSIAWWDSCNETSDERTGAALDLVRDLDPTRQWENGGFNAPHRPDDPIEDHPYLFEPFGLTDNDVRMLESHTGQPPAGGIPGGPTLTYDSPANPYLINEYAWLWVDRQGGATTLTEPVFAQLLDEPAAAAGLPAPGPAERWEAYGYLTAGLTEFWRSRRGYAGVLHFTYLGYSREEGETSDNFVDMPGLELEPTWAGYAESAFHPLGVYIDHWDSARPDPAADEGTEATVTVVNDRPATQEVTLDLLVVDDAGAVLAQASPAALSIPAYGKVDHPGVFPPAGAEIASYQLVARLTGPGEDTVVSRRKIGFAHPGVRAPAPPYE